MSSPLILPDSIKSILPNSSSKITFFQKSDLVDERTFGESYLILLDNKILTISDNQIVKELSINSLTDVKIDELAGGGRISAITEEGIIHLLYYSNNYVPHFSLAVNVIKQYLEKKKIPFYEQFENGYCKKCNSPLPERDSACPKCIPKFQILKRILSLCGPYKISVYFLMLSSAIGVCLQVSFPYFTKMIVDDVITARHANNLIKYISTMLVISILFLIARMLTIRLSAFVSSRIVKDLRDSLHSAVQFLQLRFFNRRQPGELVGRIMYDTGELLQFLVEGMPFLLINSISFIAIAIVLLKINWPLALLVFIPVPLLVSGSGWFWNILHPLFLRQGTMVGHIHSFLNESLNGLKLVKILNKEKYRINQFSRINSILSETQMKTQIIFGSFNEVMYFIMSCGVTLVWYYASKMIFDQSLKMSIGDLVAFIGYIWLFYGPLQWFSVILNWMTHAFSGAERIFEIIDSRKENIDPVDTVNLTTIKGNIAFKNVHFSYEHGKETLKGISFDIKAGEILGLVGRSGAGKSTIINLVTRFFEPDSGEILIDGFPVTKIKLELLRKNIGLVLQDPFLFNATIAENIAFGFEDKISFKQITDAARAAFAHDFIIRKPDGYDTLVGDGGVSLSGGERQRIAIARAIIQNPPILILDEATSSVDSRTEEYIQTALHEFMKGRTTLIIAHRLSTLRDADRLIVIDNGQIIETGKHEQLIKVNGVYAKMVDSFTKLNNLSIVSYN
jgi:ATP-binding cassette subfamily B protein